MAIYVIKHLSVKIVAMCDQSDIECQFALAEMIKLDNTKVLVGAIYRPLQLTIPFKQKILPSILGGEEIKIQLIGKPFVGIEIEKI